MIPNLRLQLKFKDMAIINRQTLKNYFKKGGFATEKHFVDLIDSSLNSVDDGITKTPEFGVKLSPLKSSSKLLSFFKKITQDQPDFSLNLNSNNSEGLSIDNSEDATILKLKKEGNVGIKTNNPNYTLDSKLLPRLQEGQEMEIIQSPIQLLCPPLEVKNQDQK